MTCSDKSGTLTGSKVSCLFSSSSLTASLAHGLLTGSAPSAFTAQTQQAQIQQAQIHRSNCIESLSSMLFLYCHHSIQLNTPFWAVCQFVMTGHIVGKLPYVDFVPQTQFRGVASCVVLAEMLPRLRCSPEALFDMTNQAELQSGLVAGGVIW